MAVSALFLTVYLAMLLRMQSYLINEEETSTTSNTVSSKPDTIRISLPKYIPIRHDQQETVPGNKFVDSFAKPTENYVLDSSDVWEQRNTRQGSLPSWMKDYFRWHKEVRSSLSLQNWYRNRYMVLWCHENLAKCGGTADRLSAMPFLLRLAAKSKRLLFIYWGRPCDLEHFLLPPMGGMDWRVPQLLKEKLFSRALFGRNEDDLVPLVDSNTPVITCRFQSHDHGAFYYDGMKRLDEKSFADVTRETWQVLFTPSPAVATLIVDFLNKSHLKPGRYVSAHLRALYAVQDREPALVRYWTENAVNCSSQLAPHSPIFFAADNLAASILAQRYGESAGVPVVTRRYYKTEPLHLDKATNWRNRHPSEYYDAFVDLYLLSLSRCVAYGMGGYGKFASWLSYNSSCAMQHHAAIGITPCELAMAPSSREEPESLVETASVFRPPMASEEPLPVMDRNLDNGRLLSTMDRNLDNGRLLSSPEVASGSENMGNVSSIDIWEASHTLPEWMKSYFRWHKEQRNVLNESNWREFRFLIMECVERSLHCGGTADRLSSIPFMVRLAAENARMLFVYWEKPKELESFLLPPRGGLDWRMPRWLIPELGPKAYGAVNKILPAVQNKTNRIVQARLQAHDHGSAYYNARATMYDKPLTTFRSVYHDCWHALFTPVPPIARTIEDELDRLELQPGEFAVAHLRALYGIERQGRNLALVKNWTKNALNCISSQRPGGPFLFSSDSEYAKGVAIDYGKLKHTPIRARVDAPPPVHLDVVEDWATRHASDFYDIFVDLYLMSMGRCLSYNVGGFAKWAQLIGGNGFECNRRHWTKGVDKKSANKTGCDWVEAPASSVKSGIKLKRPLFLPPISS